MPAVMVLELLRHPHPRPAGESGIVSVGCEAAVPESGSVPLGPDVALAEVWRCFQEWCLAPARFVSSSGGRGRGLERSSATEPEVAVDPQREDGIPEPLEPHGSC